MVLSRVALDSAKRSTMIALQNPALFHGAVERAFEPRTKRALWRVDMLYGRRYLLLLSEETPNLSGIVEQFGTGEAPETRDYAPLLERIQQGSSWKFRLHANPTFSSINAKGSRGKVHACTLVGMPKAEEEKPGRKTQYGWIRSQAEKHGFAVDENDLNIARLQWYAFSKPTGERVRLLGVTYEGTLTITDTQAFYNALIGGIGRGKPYGMGLLTVTRR